MRFQVIVPEGVVDPAAHTRLADELRRLAREVLGASDATVDVTEIGTGRFFTAGKPSRASLIGTGVPAGTSQADRVRLMSEITAMWCAVTGCTPGDVLVSAADA